MALRKNKMGIRITLASASPRRRNLFKQLGFGFRIMRPEITEDLPRRTNLPSRLVCSNALKKARSVVPHVREGIVVGADTIVYQRGEVFGKPRSHEEARRMLKKLSRWPHWVYTGLAVLDIDTGCEVTWFEKTKVYMRALTNGELSRYVKVGSLLDKAGGYAIQEKGDLLIERIVGDFFNVVGLPLVRLDRCLRNMMARRKGNYVGP